MSVNKKSLSRGCTVFIENPLVVLPYCEHFLTAHVFSICKIPKSSCFEGEKDTSFYFRLPHFTPVESQRILSGHEKEKFEFDLRNFGSRCCVRLFVRHAFNIQKSFGNDLSTQITLGD